MVQSAGHSDSRNTSRPRSGRQYNSRSAALAASGNLTPEGSESRRNPKSERTPEESGVREDLCVSEVQTPAAIFSAFLRASARVPTYMKALSGRSSPSPLQMRSKLSMVSSSGQVTPGRPVKTSPT